MRPSPALVTLLLPACNSATTPPDLPDPTLRSPDGATKVSGCSVLESVYSDAGCRADWSCSEGGVLGLVCAAPAATGDADAVDASDEAGSGTCACLMAGEVVKAIPYDPASCVDTGTARALATTLCGWVLP